MSLLFCDDSRSVQVVADAMAVANELIASPLRTEAVLASLIPLANTATTASSARLPLSRAAIVCELTRRLMDSAERAQLRADVRAIVSQMHPTVRHTAGRTRLWRRSSAPVASPSRSTPSGSGHCEMPPSRARALYLSYYSTLLITQFVRHFCHPLTHFLVEWIWSMDVSAHPSTAAAPSASSTSFLSSTSAQQEGVTAPPMTPQLEKLCCPEFRPHLHHPPQSMGATLASTDGEGRPPSPVCCERGCRQLDRGAAVWLSYRL